MARKGRQDRGLYQRTNSQGKAVWYVRLWHNRQERRFGSFPTKTEARQFYEKAKRGNAEQKFQPERFQKGGTTIAEVITQHVATSTVKGQYAEKAYGRWWSTELAGVRLTGLTPDLLKGAQAKLTAKNLRPQSVLHYMKFLRHILNNAVKKDKLDVNPFTKIDWVKVPKGRTRFLTTTEETTLLNELGPIYGPWARLAILTGMRLGEQFALKWSWVDFEQRLITLPDTKSGGVQYVHLNAEAQVILRTLQIQQMNQGGCGQWVFPSDNPETHLDKRNLYTRVFVPAVKRAKLEDVTWHTLRHTFASRLAMAKYSEGTIAALLRHSTTDLVKRYAHLSQDHLRGALEGLAGYGQDGEQSVSQNGTGTKTGNTSELEGVKHA